MADEGSENAKQRAAGVGANDPNVAAYHRRFFGDRPSDSVLQDLRARLPELVTLIAACRNEWATWAAELANALRLRHVTFGVRMMAHRLLAPVQDTEHVACCSWIDTSSVPVAVRQAIAAASAHAFAILTDPKLDFVATEQGLRAAAVVLGDAEPDRTVVEEPWLPINKAAQQAGVSSWIVRKGPTRKRDPLPLQLDEAGRPVKPYRARVSDVRAWNSRRVARENAATDAAIPGNGTIGRAQGDGTGVDDGHGDPNRKD